MGSGVAAFSASSCAVDVDGGLRLACQETIGALEGTFVTTIEGLSKDRSHPVQQALLATNIVQCGFCIPGVVMAASVLLRNNRNPSEGDIKEAIPNICRCGIYPRLIGAITDAARLARGDAPLANGPEPETPAPE